MVPCVYVLQWLWCSTKAFALHGLPCATNAPTKARWYTWRRNYEIRVGFLGVGMLSALDRDLDLYVKVIPA